MRAFLRSWRLDGADRREQWRLRINRYGQNLPPHWRVAINVRLGCDLLFLHRPERKAVAAMCGLGTVALPPIAVERALRMRDFRHNLISFAPTTSHTTPFCEHPNYVFLREVVIEGKGYEDTTLYREVINGHKVTRRFESGERVRLQSDADFAIY